MGRRGPRSWALKANQHKVRAHTKTGSQATLAATQARESGVVCRPGSRPASRPRAVTTIRELWCQRNIVIAERLAKAVPAQSTGRRITRRSGSRSSRASPHWARPNVTAASVGGSRLETAAPGMPTMDAG